MLKIKHTIKRASRDSRHGACGLVCALLLLAGAVLWTSPPASADSPGNSGYYAIYCDGSGNPAIKSGHHAVLDCGQSSPSVETTVKSLTSNPDGAHPVTIVEADCYPGTPKASSGSLSGNSIPCSDGPDATLTLGSHFPANKQAAQALAAKTNAKKKAGNQKTPGNNANQGANQPSNGNGGGGGNGGNQTPSANQSGVNLNVLPSPAATSGTVGRIIDVVFVIIGSFALLNITLSGLKYITSAGNEQKTAEAKNGIVYSLVGLVIAIAAEAIVAFVVHRT